MMEYMIDVKVQSCRRQQKYHFDFVEGIVISPNEDGIKSDMYEGTRPLTDLYKKINFCCLRLSASDIQPHAL